MAKDPETLAHQEWLGFVQPVGLVVSIPALLAAQAVVNRNIISEHQKFLACLPKDEDVTPAIADFPAFAQTVLGWEPADLDGSPKGKPLPSSLEVALPDYHEILRPAYAVREFQPKDPARPWMMLIQTWPAGQDLDQVVAEDDRHWQASPQSRFERLLHDTQMQIGILFNGTHLRLVYRPPSESSGHVTFPVGAMRQVAGRPIFAAMHMLLCAERLFSLPEKQRLPAILADSRKYQNVVSTQLAQQVLAALYELLRGFQAADDQRKGELLRQVLAEDPNHVYAGLLTVLMRLVFILFAEDRGLLSTDPIYTNHYSVAGLFERLRADAGRYPDTMDQRYGAWAQLLTLFRLIYDGGSHAGFHIPGRRGYLFDPDRYNFLEGRPWRQLRASGEKLDVPRVSDGVIWRVLDNLLILNGERLSYRMLDVEQIGSVYETIMGFNLQVAGGRSIAIKPVKSHGAPAAINLEELLAAKPADRAKWLVDHSDQKLTGPAAEALKNASTIEDLLAALEKKIARHATPNVAPKGAMVLQPSDERRRSGSHYTPRSFTEPIVRTTLRPILQRLGEKPNPEQILDLKICDIAIGSGAFQVETCRQLGDELVKAWHAHGRVPKLPPDEDEVLHARRLVAQRCIYGVDKNPMAVDLAKLSLWLVTLAKDHPFTFLDHALRCGDTLVGLTRKQILAFHWQDNPPQGFESLRIGNKLLEAQKRRFAIQNAPDDMPEAELQQWLRAADQALDDVRLLGDLVVFSFFDRDKDRAREQLRLELLGQTSEWLTGRRERGELEFLARQLRVGEHPLSPFHWEIEFPEVFGRDNPGFDAIVGNPPFMGGKRISGGLGKTYADWLVELHAETSGNADLVAHFYRRAFSCLCPNGTFGLIATNTIAQGDTRRAGLRWIGKNGGEIFEARRRLRWPGSAAVVVSVVDVWKGRYTGPRRLDDRPVRFISAFLFHGGTHDDPLPLAANRNRSFIGCDIKGQGFLFDDTDPNATPVSRMRALVAQENTNAECILPYIGGEELNTSPTQTHSRWVICFGEMTEQEIHRWPALRSIVEEKVRPDRLTKSPDLASWPWWQFWRVRRELQN
ncbi:MAG: DNA methyltransferase, partial [Tepidisphaeraceae bacterium]